MSEWELDEQELDKQEPSGACCLRQTARAWPLGPFSEASFLPSAPLSLLILLSGH